MSIKKDHERMDKLDKTFSLVQQSSAKGGTSAIEIAKKLGAHRTTVHGYLTSLELMGKVESRNSLWYAKTDEQTIKPLEKEIIIELPLPKSEVQKLSLLEQLDKDWNESFPNSESVYKTVINKMKETRTIRITGKNVDDLDLEKVTKLIEQAEEKSFSNSLKKAIKKLRKTKPNKSATQSSKT